MVVQYILACRKVQKEIKVDVLNVEEERQVEEVISENGKEKQEQIIVDPEKEQNDTKFVEVEEYYVKYRNFSYLHCEWKTEEELFKGDKRISAKLKRFKQKQSQQTNIFENVGHYIHLILILQVVLLLDITFFFYYLSLSLKLHRFFRVFYSIF